MRSVNFDPSWGEIVPPGAGSPGSLGEQDAEQPHPQFLGVRVGLGNAAWGVEQPTHLEGVSSRERGSRMLWDILMGLFSLDLKGEAVLGARQETAPQLPALTPEEKRVLERKLKKQRKKEQWKRLRESGAAQSLPAKRSGAQLALDYLCG